MATKRNNGFIDHTPTMADIRDSALARIQDAAWDMGMIEGNLSDRGYPEVALRYDAIRDKLNELEAELRKLPLLHPLCINASLASSVNVLIWMRYS